MSGNNDQTKKDQKSTGLKKCFSALVDRKQVNLDIDVLNLMLKKELQINIDVLDQHLAEVLPLMLVLYMKSWPGWQRSKEYYSGKLNFKEWYEKFRQYIVLRLNYLIKNGYNSVIEEMKREKKREMERISMNKTYAEHGSQTDLLAPKSFAPFTICITCPASGLNSIVFAECEDNIIIRQLQDSIWPNIEIKQLLHWPNIEVEFFTPELSFKRRNCFEYNRYINLVNTPLSYERPDFIDQVEIIDPSSGRNCYTLNMLRCYIKEYLSILKSVDDGAIDVGKVEIILNEFLLDIKEIDMNNTMATNTSVVFNIGGCTFLRRRTPKESYCKQTTVCFCENIIPKMETSLNFFKGVQDQNTPEVSFSYLNIIKNSLKTKNINETISLIRPLIVYKCNYCEVSYKDDLELVKHLKEKHKMDPQVLCVKCKTSVSVIHLASLRWKHVCNSS